MGRPAIALPPEAEAILTDGAASGLNAREVTERLAAVGVRVSSQTINRRLVTLRGRVRSSKNLRLERVVAPKQVHECITCRAPIVGTGTTGLCHGCIARARAEAKAPEGTVWLVLPNGKRRRASVCHPDRPAVSGDACSMCHARTRPQQWRSDQARRNAADAQADRRRRAAEAKGRTVKPFQPAALHPCKASGCGGLIGVSKTYCSPECRPAKKARAGCSVCGAPTVGQRKTCSDPCFAESAARRRALVGSQLTSYGQPILRSESTRARRRKDRATRYKRPDKAEVIARLTAEQDGKCKVCGCDGGERGLVLDHCHRSGEPRAMLCCRCNAALGLMLEQPKRIEGLLAYALAWSA